MNSAGPAVVGHFGDQPRLVRGQFLYCHDVGNALASIRDAGRLVGGEMLPHVHGFHLRPQ